jgi:cobalamin biosynthesis protein CbiG
MPPINLARVLILAKRSSRLLVKTRARGLSRRSCRKDPGIISPWRNTPTIQAARALIQAKRSSRLLVKARARGFSRRSRRKDPGIISPWRDTPTIQAARALTQAKRSSRLLVKTTARGLFKAKPPKRTWQVFALARYAYYSSSQSPDTREA